MPQFLSLNLEYLFYQIYHFFYSIFHRGEGAPGQPAHAAVPLYSGVAIFFFLLLTLMLVWLIGYLLVKIRHEHIDHDWYLYHQAQKIKAAVAATEENPQWKSVTSFASSDHSSDWKVAVIEADKILDEAVQLTNAPGENLGERLKSFDEKTASWLGDAWDAHKIRNRIAHEPDFVLDRRQCQITIAKYERVLRALRAI